MTTDRKELRAEMDELRVAPLDEDNLTPTQQSWADATYAIWGGDEITLARERWAARMLHLSADRRSRAIRSAYRASAAAMQKGLA